MDSKPIAARLESSSLSSGTTYDILRSMRITLVSVLIATLLFSAVPVHAATLEEATVNLYCRMKLSGRTYSSTGTGVVVNERGIILTNAHVAQRFLLATSTSKTKTECTIRTGSPAKSSYTAEVLYMPPGWFTSYAEAIATKDESTGTGEYDFALLAITGTTSKKQKLPTNFPALSLASSTPIEGASVTIAGYPAEKLDYMGVRDKLAFLTASSTVTGFRTFMRPHNDILLIAPSKAGQSGVSGGPVVNSSQAIVGIVSTMGGEKTGGLRSLRAVSHNHLERVVLATTGTTFAALLSGDIRARTQMTEASIPTDFRTNLEKTIRRIGR